MYTYIYIYIYICIYIYMYRQRRGRPAAGGPLGRRGQGNLSYLKLCSNGFY